MNEKEMKAVNGNVAVVDDKKEAITSGGIVLPDNSEENRVICGTVLSVSPFLLEDGSLKDPQIAVGDRVVYAIHAGAGSSWINNSDRLTYRLIKWNEILAKL